MGSADLFRLLTFHDSVVNKITFDNTAREFRLDIELGNYNQREYDASKDPEILPGQLVFSGVSALDYEPENAFAPWRPDVDGEIIDLDVEPGDGDFRAKLVISVADYQSKTNETFVFRLQAADATWRPEISS